jgi:heptosyltransferase-2
MDPHSESLERSNRLARIFLKPLVERYHWLVRLLEIPLRALAAFQKPAAPGPLEDIRRILVFDPGGLGDMVLLMPLLRNLRTRFPASHVALLGRRDSVSFLLDQGLIDERLPIEMPWGVRLSRLQRHNPFAPYWIKFFREVRSLRRTPFDLAISAGWGADLRGNLVVWLTGARRRVGYGYGGGAFLLTDVVAPDLGNPHVAVRNLRLLEGIGLNPAQPEQMLTVSREDQQLASELLASHGVTADDDLIGVHPGAGLSVREWGEDRFAEVVLHAKRKFDAKVIWFSDPAKPRPLPPGSDAIPLALSPRQFLAVVARCKLFLCNDSGPMHVAAGLNVPVVAVFGPQRPEWFGPWGQGHSVVIRQDIWCRPCGGNCIWDQPYCLRLISVDQVKEAVAAALSRLKQERMSTT